MFRWVNAAFCGDWHNDSADALTDAIKKGFAFEDAEGSVHLRFGATIQESPSTSVLWMMKTSPNARLTALG